MALEARSSSKPERLCFVGSMVGRNPGHISQQGEVVSSLFRQAGHPVIAVSSSLSRYRRLGEIVDTLVRRRDEFDILVVEIYGGRSFVVEDIASFLGRRFGKPIIMWLHGGALPDFMARFPSWTRRVLSRADAILTPSSFLSRAVAPFGFQARIIPNVIELADYPYRRRQAIKPRLFWMRSFHRIWNPAMAIRVLTRLRRWYPEATLVMAGPDKGTRQETEQLATAGNLDDHVRFTGFLNLAGKICEGDAADIFINTNRIDNTPVAVVEACALGLPVVSTNVGGIPDLLTHGVTGLLVPDDDDEAMALEIRRLLEHPELTERLSHRGRLLAERFSWQQVRPQWEQIFADLLFRGSLSSPSTRALSYRADAG